MAVLTGTSVGTSGGPEMAAFTDAAHQGMYITVWSAAGGPSDSNSTGVVGQIFGADGQPLGNAFREHHHGRQSELPGCDHPRGR